ncbi:MAG: hypothetical protein ACOC3X_02875 [Nanoarchaeota archaeon]
MKKKLAQELNEYIFEQGSGFGPSLACLLNTYFKHKKVIHPENEEIIKSRLKGYKQIYENFIIPKFSNIIEGITSNSNINFPKTKKQISNQFMLRSFEDVRKKVRNSYDKQYSLDNITLNAMNSNQPMPTKNDYINFYFNNQLNHIFSYRFKLNKKIDGKIKNIIRSIKHKYLTEKLGENFYEDESTSKIKDYEKQIYRTIDKFIVEVCKDTNHYWNNYSNYHKKYNEKINKLMLADILGFSIVELDQKKAEENINNICYKLSNGSLNLKGFYIIDHRCDDHRERLNYLKPGGVHITLVDKGLSNYPLELHYLDHKSKVYDMFGPNAHFLYDQKGKIKTLSKEILDKNIS